ALLDRGEVEGAQLVLEPRAPAETLRDRERVLAALAAHELPVEERQVVHPLARGAADLEQVVDAGGAFAGREVRELEDGHQLRELRLDALELPLRHLGLRLVEARVRERRGAADDGALELL